MTSYLVWLKGYGLIFRIRDLEKCEARYGYIFLVIIPGLGVQMQILGQYGPYGEF